MEPDITQAVQSPEWGTVTLVVLVVGCICFGVTEVLKLVFQLITGKKPVNPLWWRILIRLFPMLVGGVMGQFFLVWPWGVSIGAGAGVVCALVYKKVKELIIGAKETDLKK